MRIFCITLLFLYTINLEAAKIPEWAIPHLYKSSAKWTKSDDAVTLYSENIIEVKANGKITKTIRGIVKVLHNDGKNYAQWSDSYSIKDSKILDTEAFLLTEEGKIHIYDKSNVLHSAVQGQLKLYSDKNNISLSAVNDAAINSRFIYEYKIETKTNFSQLLFKLPNDIPSLESIYRVKLPEGWKLKAHYKNQLEIEELHNLQSNTYTWMTEIEPEKSSEQLNDPAIFQKAICIDFFPANNQSSQLDDYLFFSSWKEIASYYEKIEKECAQPDEAIQLKVEELITGQYSLEEKLKALAYYTQTLNYISILESSTFGGGYTPHKASEIFKLNYGDCKDKTTLLCAMLRSIGVEAYYASCYSGKNSRVDPDWPSRLQFNHAITAIKVPSSLKSRAIIECPDLGPLLIFDPTNRVTAFGDIPDRIRGGFIHVHAKESTGLLQIPEYTDQFDVNRHDLKAELSSNGELSFTFDLFARGKEAHELKHKAKELSKNEFINYIFKEIKREGLDMNLDYFEKEDFHKKAAFHIAGIGNIEDYKKHTDEGLLVFKPFLFSWQKFILKENRDRKSTIRLPGNSYEERIEIELPETHSIDELGKDLDIKTPFGTYLLTFSVKRNTLEIFRSLKINPVSLPKEDYPEVQQFIKTIYDSERSPIVMILKNQ